MAIPSSTWLVHLPLLSKEAITSASVVHHLQAITSAIIVDITSAYNQWS